VELRRIDRYFGAVKGEVREASGPGSAALGTVEQEHEKRRNEETRRHEVRVSVEPHAERYLSGEGGWGIHLAAGSLSN
jgi:hypothetical protein